MAKRKTRLLHAGRKRNYRKVEARARIAMAGPGRVTVRDGGKKVQRICLTCEKPFTQKQAEAELKVCRPCKRKNP